MERFSSKVTKNLRNRILMPIDKSKESIKSDKSLSLILPIKGYEP